ncbi:MAG: hypothetical protein QXO30_03830 [Candidatus Caldarchaeum sp.]
MAGSTLKLLALVSVIWLMFLAASSLITLIIMPVVDMQSSTTMSAARTLAGMAVFGLWVYGWQKTAEFWLYKILLRADEE